MERDNPPVVALKDCGIALASPRNDAGARYLVSDTPLNDMVVEERSPTCDKLDQVADSTGIAPFVVVPGQDLDEGPVYNRRREAVNNRRERIAVKIGGDQRLLTVAKNPFQLPIGGLPQGRVHLCDGNNPLRLCNEIDQRHIRRGDADGEPVHLALQRREYQADRLGRSRTGGNLGESGSPRPAEIGMRQIQDLLIIGVGVDGGHEAMADSEVLHDDLRDRRKAVGGAGRIADDRVLLRIVHRLIDTQHDRNIRVLGGG